MTCKGICLDFVAKKSKPRSKGRYESGQKRCTLCDVFLDFEGDRCPCCNRILRKKPRVAEARNKMVEKFGNQK